MISQTLEQTIMRAETTDLDAAVRKAIETSPFVEHLKDLLIEEGKGGDDAPFLRIVLVLDTFKGVEDEAMEDAIKSIEERVIAVDDRFPSVRFSDAA